MGKAVWINFRKKTRKAVENQKLRIMLQVRQTRGLYVILQKWKSGMPLTDSERRFATEQLLKIALGIPALAILLLPFGSVILVVLLKYLPIQTLTRPYHKIV
jgi:hypothetical protein